MTGGPSPLEEALQQLSTAIDLMDAAVTRRRAADKSESDRATELELMRADRARLAELLDDAIARTRRQQVVHDELSARIDAAIGHVRQAIAVERQG